MFYKAKKHLSQNSCHRIHNSACGGVTKENIWMGNHHELSSNNNNTDALERYLTDVIYPVVRSQGSMLKTPATGITR